MRIRSSRRSLARWGRSGAVAAVASLLVLAGCANDDTTVSSDVEGGAGTTASTVETLPPPDEPAAMGLPSLADTRAALAERLEPLLPEGTPLVWRTELLPHCGPADERLDGNWASADAIIDPARIDQLVADAEDAGLRIQRTDSHRVLGEDEWQARVRIDGELAGEVTVTALVAETPLPDEYTTSEFAYCG